MKYLIPAGLRLKIIVLMVFTLGLSVASKGQTRATESLLKIAREPEDQEEQQDDDDATQEEPGVKYVTKKEVKHNVRTTRKGPELCQFFFLDYGTSKLKNSTSAGTQYSNGPTFAGSFQVGAHYRSRNNNSQFVISTGLELRNFNGTYSPEDGSGILRDRFHYWYLGVPIMFQVVGTRNYDDYCENDVNFYLQLGMTTGLKLVMLENSESGKNTPENISGNYDNLMFQPFASGGISYTTKKKIWLLGPYVGYSVNNINSKAGVKESVSGFGIRLTGLLFR